MRLFTRPAIGIVGQIFAILLLALLVEYGATSFLYERADQFSIRDDEANRLAEHIVLARKVVNDEPVPTRAAIAEELTTSRYLVRWQRQLPLPPFIAPSLDRMRGQIVTWEPELAGRDLKLRLKSPGRNAYITGGVTLDDGSWLYFETREPLNHLGFSLSRLLLALTPAIALIFIGGLLVRNVLRPLRQLAVTADRLGHGTVEPIAAEGPSEVRRLINAFNDMQSRIHRLISARTEALAAVGHDFRTPLARLRLRADAVRDEELRDAMLADVVEMDAMVASLLAYLGGEEDHEAPVRTDLAVICATVVEHATDLGQAAEYHGPDHLEATVRPLGLKRAIVNLVDNALHYGGNARLCLERTATQIRLRVEDDGPGIPEDQQVQVLQPFVRLDGARSRDTPGFGLGLPIVVRAVELEGGSLTLRNLPAGGLSAEIWLPVARS
ncbi:Signal transduction histidine kinase [Sphingomonas guangdongensis]|uniref:histidine kinase n=1 Tax=Sphingomonas guangdongensis TaxID=1141890 RepID=A0A285QDW7_9SPHN|nr:ATP-binding protein [Sphingomonas guangdongensis]SOB80036.1 Signal transduction histidine kinase [Sphingomonas guangdongensis]